MGKKEITIACIIKLATIVTLQETNGEGEVSSYVALEIHKETMHIRFGSNRKTPYIMRVVIKHYKIIFETRDTRNR